METYSVYITQNLLDLKKAYVGMTKFNNENYYGSDKDLKNDIKELGKENFSKTFLGTFNTWQECHYMEGFYIRTLKTHISEGGYNKWINGGNYILMTDEIKKKLSKSHKGKPSHRKGVKLSEETKAKISRNSRHFQSEETKKLISKNHARWMKGKHHTEETKQKLRKPASDVSKEKNRLSHLGLISPRKGVKLSEETKAKISASLKLHVGWHFSEEAKEHMRHPHKKNKKI
jgi:hypothetical protein